MDTDCSSLKDLDAEVTLLSSRTRPRWKQTLFFFYSRFLRRKPALISSLEIPARCQPPYLFTTSPVAFSLWSAIPSRQDAGLCGDSALSHSLRDTVQVFRSSVVVFTNIFFEYAIKSKVSVHLLEVSIT